MFEEPDRIEFLVRRKIGLFIGQDKAFYSFNKKLLKKIESKGKKYDFFLVIRGNIISNETIAEIHSKYLSKNALSVYYSWDSFGNMIHKGSIGNYFMKRYTFDSVDAKNNPDYELLPLFYTSTFVFIKKKDEPKYDLCCVGCLTLDRYSLVKEIIKNNPNLNICVKLYTPKRQYIVDYLIEKGFRNLDFSMITFTSLSQEELADLYRQSKAVLDIPSFTQSGLSMRTIESIGMRKKIVTTNPHIMEYPFYSAENVIILRNGKSLKINKSWVNSPANYDEEQRQQLSIDNWAMKLLSK